MSGMDIFYFVIVLGMSLVIAGLGLHLGYERAGLEMYAEAHEVCSVLRTWPTFYRYFSSCFPLLLGLLCCGGFLDDEPSDSAVWDTYLVCVMNYVWFHHPFDPKIRRSTDLTKSHNLYTAKMLCLTCLILFDMSLFSLWARSQAIQTLNHKYWYEGEGFDYFGKAYVAYWVPNNDNANDDDGDNDVTTSLTLEWSCPNDESGAVCQYEIEEAYCNFPQLKYLGYGHMYYRNDAGYITYFNFYNVDENTCSAILENQGYDNNGQSAYNTGDKSSDPYVNILGSCNGSCTALPLSGEIEPEVTLPSRYARQCKVYASVAALALLVAAAHWFFGRRKTSTDMGESCPTDEELLDGTASQAKRTVELGVPT